MQIIIDIPEDTYHWIIDNPQVYTGNLDIAVRNGVPLDAIKSDIQYARESPTGSIEFDNGLDLALKTIDKHIGKADE